jgi:hypothetical protein
VDDHGCFLGSCGVIRRTVWSQRTVRGSVCWSWPHFWKAERGYRRRIARARTHVGDVTCPSREREHSGRAGIMCRQRDKGDTGGPRRRRPKWRPGVSHRLPSPAADVCHARTHTCFRLASRFLPKHSLTSGIHDRLRASSSLSIRASPQSRPPKQFRRVGQKNIFSRVLQSRFFVRRPPIRCPVSRARPRPTGDAGRTEKQGGEWRGRPISGTIEF